jgi:DNA end-binding protein Ku
VAPARPYWKGYLRLSLVTPVPSPFPPHHLQRRGCRFGRSTKRPATDFGQHLVDEVTREPVSNEDKGRGYEFSKNAYILVDDDELDAIAVESTHTIEIDSFVPREQIDERYLDSPYYITPDDKVGQEAFAVIREAMRGKWRWRGSCSASASGSSCSSPGTRD